MRKLVSISFLLLLTCFLFAQKEDLNTRFLQAVKGGNVQEVELLLKKGANVNCKDENGKAGLHLAVVFHNYDLAELLIKKGADINAKDKDNSTPLMYTGELGDLRISYLLFINGAYFLLKDNFNKSAYDYAISGGYLRVASFLNNPKSYSKKSTYSELINQANNFYKNNDINKAIQYAEKALKTAKNELVQIHLDNAYIRDRLGLFNTEIGEYKKAENNYLVVLNIRKSILGINHINYAISLNNLGDLYREMKKFKKSEQLFIESLKIKKILSSDSSSIYAISLHNLGRLYKDMGDFTKAEFVLNQSLKIKKNTLGDQNSSYAKTLTVLINLCQLMNNFEKIEPLYLEYLKYEKIKLGENDQTYASDLFYLGTLYLNNGNYSAAEKLLVESMKIRKIVLGDTHPDYATSLSKIANLYEELGNYDKATLFCIEAMGIRKMILGKKHPDYANSLEQLAIFYYNIEDYQEALPLYLEALKIRKTVFGTKHRGYISLINNLAAVYNKMGNYDKALKLCLAAIETSKTVLGESSNGYISSLNLLAEIYGNMGLFVKSEEIYSEVINKSKSVFKTTNPKYTISLNNLASIYSENGDFVKAELLNIESSIIDKNNIQNNFMFLSDKERNLYWDIKKHMYNSYYASFGYNYYPKNPSISTFAYDNTLFTKGLLLNTSLQIQNTVLQSGDTALIGTWNNLRDLKRQLNILQSKPLAQQGDLSVMEAQADSLDKVLTQKSQLYKQSQSDMQVKWTDVQKNLKPDEAAIEFISFNYFNKHYTDSTMYCALVLKKNSPYPEMIPLFEEKQLDSLFVKSSSDVNQLYTYRVTNLRKDTAESRLNYGSKLYNLLWKPLEASLKNTKTVYFAPSGKLNQVAFVAIPVDSTLLLSDKYNLHQVTSTRQVIHNNDQNGLTAKIHDAALFGGIQYELDNKQLAQVQTTTGTNYRSAFVSDSTQRSGSFGYLKGTGEEVTGIAEEFKQKGLTEQLYTGAVANEAAFKKLSGTNTDIIHIATHGFYLPIEDTKPKDFKFMSFDNDRRNVVVHNPLLRSGLAFAGANRAWRGDSIPDNWEDGILTSHEISQLNLTHTDLVVLSACETALGDVKGSEGVFGLQRAFKMAGVQTLIMSLWKVPDTQTSQLMQGFYKYWLGGMTKHDAFKKSQNEIRKANPNPYFWAAFVMVD